MSNRQPKWYTEAAEWLSNNSPEYEAVLYSMGAPVEDTSIPTAQVSLTEDRTDTVLTVNPDFVDGMDPKNIAAVLMHEAVHLLKRHLSELVDAKKNGFNHRGNLVKTHEVITNDYIRYLGFELPDIEDESGNIIPARQAFYFGPDNVNTITIGMSTRQVYDLFDNSNDNDDSNDCSCGHGDDSDSDNRDVEVVFARKVAGNPDADGSVDQLLDNFSDKEVGRDDDDSDSLKYVPSTGFDEDKANILAEKYGTTAEWLRLLHEVNPDFLKKGGGARPRMTRADWTRPNRRASALPGSMKFPARKHTHGEMESATKGDKPSIVIALDTSASIPRDMVDRMVTMISSVPEDLIDVNACTFSTRYVPFEPGGRVAMGGTDFSAVHGFVKSLDRKPSSVIVMTDGEASFRSGRPGQSDLDDKYMWILFRRSDRLRWVYGANEESVRYLDEFFPSAVINSVNWRLGF